LVQEPTEFRPCCHDSADRFLHSCRKPPGGAGTGRADPGARGGPTELRSRSSGSSKVAFIVRSEVIEDVEVGTQLQDAEAIIRSSGIGIENAVGGFKVNVSAAVGGQAAAGLPDSRMFVAGRRDENRGRLSELSVL